MDTALRLLVIGQEFLIAVIFLSARAAAPVRISGALLVLCVAGYLFASDPFLREAAPILTPLATLLAIAAPYGLWAFARAIFEAPWPDIRITSAVVAVVVAGWSIVTIDTPVLRAWADLASNSVRVLSVVVVAHVLWLAWAGRPDDLVEPRRSFRLIFIGVVAAQVMAVLVAELILGLAAVPTWLESLNVIVIGMLTLGLAVPLLSLNREFFATERAAGPPGSATETQALRPTERALRDKLLELMGSGYYRETGLTISRLAGQLGYPEHQVRRLINGRLGYRNFSAFLNYYRINEAKQHLADPGKARTPVLTIALDLGYASIGPFNRSFKELTGITPTDYRRRQLATSASDSE